MRASFKRVTFYYPININCVSMLGALSVLTAAWSPPMSRLGKTNSYHYFRVKADTIFRDNLNMSLDKEREKTTTAVPSEEFN